MERVERQRRVGWLLVVVSAACLAYFLKVRLLTPGPFIERREWLQTFALVVILMLGVINVRLAAGTRAKRAAQLRK
jgi:hypothetical protein